MNKGGFLSAASFGPDRGRASEIMIDGVNEQTVNTVRRPSYTHFCRQKEKNTVGRMGVDDVIKQSVRKVAYYVTGNQERRKARGQRYVTGCPFCQCSGGIFVGSTKEN